MNRISIAIIVIYALSVNALCAKLEVWAVAYEWAKVLPSEAKFQPDGSNEIDHVFVLLYKPKDLVKIVSEDVSLEKIYSLAGEGDRFVGSGTEYLIREVKKDIWYKVYLENSFERKDFDGVYRIAPCNEILDSVLTVADIPLVGNDSEFLLILYNLSNRKGSS